MEKITFAPPVKCKSESVVSALCGGAFHASLSAPPGRRGDERRESVLTQALHEVVLPRL